MSSSKLTAAELSAWDLYAAAVARATLTNWYRWKLGVPVDYAVVVTEATRVADALMVERRSR